MSFLGFISGRSCIPQFVRWISMFWRFTKNWRTLRQDWPGSTKEWVIFNSLKVCHTNLPACQTDACSWVWEGLNIHVYQEACWQTQSPAALRHQKLDALSDGSNNLIKSSVEFICSAQVLSCKWLFQYKHVFHLLYNLDSNYIYNWLQLDNNKNSYK